MNCFYHHDASSVAICKNCQRGLCPACAADVVNGTACRDRCEAQVWAINEVIERNKTGYQKASAAYARNAILYALLGGAMVLIGAAFSYSSSRKMRQVGP